MKVCLIGDFSAHLDEGFKNVTHHLAQGLSRHHELLRVDIKRPLRAAFWLSRLPRPDVVHYLSAPTAPTFLLLALIRLCWPAVPTVVSSLHPSALGLGSSQIFRRLVRISRPTLVLVQNPPSAKMFRGLDCRIRYLPNGVDTKRFLPASEARRNRLRRKYGLREEQYIVVHVGHLRPERNLDVMSRLQAHDTQVLIVGGTYLGEDRQLRQRLEDQGCLVWTGYFPRIEEVYALADAFVFPTALGGSLFMPLSVMEAMACDLPVLSTRFEGLEHYFRNTPGLIFTPQDDIPRALQRWRQSGLRAGTRQRVEFFSWARVVEHLDSIYYDLVTGG